MIISKIWKNKKWSKPPTSYSSFLKWQFFGSKTVSYILDGTLSFCNAAQRNAAQRRFGRCHEGLAVNGRCLTMKDFGEHTTRGAPVNHSVQLVNITPATMVYGTYNYSTVIWDFGVSNFSNKPKWDDFWCFSIWTIWIISIGIVIPRMVEQLNGFPDYILPSSVYTVFPDPWQLAKPIWTYNDFPSKDGMMSFDTF